MFGVALKGDTPKFRPLHITKSLWGPVPRHVSQLGDIDHEPASGFLEDVGWDVTEVQSSLMCTGAFI